MRRIARTIGRRRGRESLAGAIRQSERGGQDGGPAFDWDIVLCVGDLSGTQTFTEGSRRVRVQCYLHTSEHFPQRWCVKAELALELTGSSRPPEG